MRIERRNGYRLIVGGPVPPQADAITLGRTILVRKAAASSERLLSHELVHVRQFAELGFLRFSARYVGAYLRFRLSGWGHLAAYRRIPLEVEASWVSRLHRLHELEPARTVSRPGNRTARRRAASAAPRSPRSVPRLHVWNRSARAANAAATLPRPGS